MQGTETTTPTGDSTATWLVEAISELQALLKDLAATEGKFAASAVLLFVLFVGVFVVPAVVARVRAALLRQVTEGHAAGVAGTLNEYVPTSFSGLLLRTTQLCLLAVVIASFLVVWGVLDLAAVTDRLTAPGGPDVVNLGVTVLLVAFAFALSDQLKRTVAGFSRRLDQFTEHQEEILLRVGQVTVFVTTGAVILGVWNVDLSGLLIGAGFLGIVVGFAARKTLGSFVAGFVLMFSRPFTIGDWVAIADREGIVTDITVFNTRLENFDGEFIVIPNDQVSDEAITNKSRKDMLRLRKDVGIDYADDPEEAVDVAIDTMSDLDEVLDAPSPQVIPREFGDSGVVLELRFWIDHPTPPRKWKAVSAVVREVTTAFDEAGITIPYPQRTIDARSGALAAAGDPGSLADGERTTEVTDDEEGTGPDDEEDAADSTGGSSEPSDSATVDSDPASNGS